MVVYEFLTGELPFDTKGSIAAGTAPPYLSAADKPDWEEYQAVILLQQTWVCSQMSHVCFAGPVQQSVMLLYVQAVFVVSHSVLVHPVSQDALS